MRAMVLDGFGGPEVLRPAEVPAPEAVAPTDVVVRVQAAGINPIDLKTRAGGGVAALLPADGPKILGWDVAGVVESVGRGVTRFAPGDPVFGMPWFPRPAGAYAEYVAAPSRQFAALPPNVSAADAASVPLAALTARQALSLAAVGPGSQVLVHGAAGGVGYLAVQLAVALGARVVATARGEDAALLRELGAERVLDYRGEPFEKALGPTLDAVIDLHGADGYPQRSLEVLRDGGTLVVVPSVAPRPEPERDVRVTGVMVEPDRADLEAVAALIASGAVRVRGARTFPLREAAEAHRALESGEVRGKAVLLP
ncbi:zinc-binding dehydrogenase [Streptomyces sp. SCUT-3]|uniref:NADP-dependent oxidoreductase n=1 Tax=Streptomyces TaxID=1883 RepID=UPI0015FAB745|nr:MULTISPECIES: NADP-dependent oxidoreductase [unclassified Streptomyces]MCZ2527684.1 NADP-dependent oxidoreductase [Streptomyces sp. HB2AG]QMV21989.1 zinc-binding dehydrogenase [Streptomyces sp. SCUT-3]